MRCGLLGKKLGHSYSPQIHSYLGSYTYDLFEKSPDELQDFLKNGDFSGLNVTIPYKKDVIPYCDKLSECAKRLGAVNTIVRQHDGTLIGHNSDYYGFQSMLKKSGLSVSGKKALVLGNGGAAATVIAVLKELNANVIVISRSGENNYENISRHSDCKIIVNTTPVGMYPNTGVSPVDLDLFPALEGVFDVIYNPARTKLLLDAEERGIVTQNGLWMLVAQAKESAEWFTDSKISDSVIDQIHNTLRKQMENIVLIGMPGSGKTTVGKCIAKKTGKYFIDTDEEIERLSGITIPEMFSKYGDEYFRQQESNILDHYGKQSGLIISTGGGCVTRTENRPYLHQNGRIIWLQRDIALLPTDGRPLSQQNKLEDLYRARKPLYAAFADYTATNDGDLDKTVEIVLNKVWYE